MFIVLLKFSAEKAQASQWMEQHNVWLKTGFDDGVFLVAGSLKPSAGGMILAHGLSHEALDERVGQDPFVVANVVQAEILEVTPGLTDPRLAFLKLAA
jgi:uncharacterized protein YciI